MELTLAQSLKDFNGFPAIYGGGDTLYARAIAAKYRSVIPAYYNLQTGIDITNPSNCVVGANLQYDALLIAGNYTSTDSSGDVDLTFVRVTDLETGTGWNASGPINGSPIGSMVSANGPLAFSLSQVLPLPEAYFLRAGVKLQHDFFGIGDSIGGGILTWHLWLLVDPLEGKSPECVRLDNGEEVKVGTRVPWFYSVGLGTETAGPTYILNTDQVVVQYTEPDDCEIELYGFSINHSVPDVDPPILEDILLKVADTGRPRFSQINRTPSTAICGWRTKVTPWQPLTVPYTLPRGHQLQITAQYLNPDDNDTPDNHYVTATGVRKCLYN